MTKKANAAIIPNVDGSFCKRLNLLRLRLIGLGGIQIKDIDSQNYAIKDYQKVVLTQFGWAFIVACRGPNAGELFK